MSKRAYTVENIEAMKYECLNWDDYWRNPFGNPAVNAMWSVQGISASGKSSFVMQLSKKLCEYGNVLYLPYEEGVGREFQRRLKYLHMSEVKGHFMVAPEDTFDELADRLSRSRSARFVVIDSFQVACELFDWSYERAVELKRLYPKKGFIFVNQEHKGQPIGKPAIRLKYMADMKVRVAGYKAYCQGRATGDPGSFYPVWDEGIIKTSNNL